jgi:hypothetical protein
MIWAFTAQNINFSVGKSTRCIGRKSFYFHFPNALAAISTTITDLSDLSISTRYATAQNINFSAGQRTRCIGNWYLNVQPHH